jgi:hypothetical protein
VFCYLCTSWLSVYIYYNIFILFSVIHCFFSLGWVFLMSLLLCILFVTFFPSVTVCESMQVNVLYRHHKSPATVMFSARWRYFARALRTRAPHGAVRIKQRCRNWVTRMMSVRVDRCVHLAQGMDLSCCGLLTIHAISCGFAVCREKHVQCVISLNGRVINCYYLMWKLLCVCVWRACVRWVYAGEYAAVLLSSCLFTKLFSGSNGLNLVLGSCC